MATYESILQMFDLLMAGGLRPPKTWSKAAGVTIYADILAACADVEVHAAALHYLRSAGQWWPTPGQLLALPAHRPLTWQDAFLALEGAVEEQGADAPPGTSWEWCEGLEPRMSATIKACGGWHSICRLTNYEWSALRTAFRETWDGMRSTSDAELRAIAARPPAPMWTAITDDSCVQRLARVQAAKVLRLVQEDE